MEGHEVYIPIQTDPTAVANRFAQEISLQRAVALPLAEDTTLTAEARTEAQERFDTAQARLTELATSTITNFQNQRERVGEVLANRRASVRGGEGVFNPQTDVSPVSKSVTELLTAVRENLLPVDFMAGVDPDVRDFALRTLKAMSDKYQLYGLDTYSPEVWGMIDRLTKGDVEIASLKEQFDEFKASHVRRRPEVVKEYSDLLLDSLSEVPQHARELFVSEDENPQDMEYIADDMLDPTPPPIEEKKDPRRREGQVEVVSLNDIEKEKFGELTKKITGALDDNYAGRDDKAEGDTIGYDEWNDLSSYVRFGTPLSTINPERLAIVLNKLGVSGVEFNEFNALGQRYFAKMQEEGQGVRTMYVQDKGLIESLGQAQVSFSVESFVREYLDVGENGVEQMQLTPQKRAQFKDMIEGYVFEAVKNVDPTLSWEDAFGPQEQEYTRTIRGYLNGIAQSKELAAQLGGTTTESYREVKQFLDSQLGYVNTLTNMYQIFHNLPQSAHDGSIFEKWPQFMTRIMSSEFAEVLRGDLVQIAIDTHAQHIHNRIIQNNNVVPSDLFAGELKTKLGERRNEDFDAIQRQILERAKSMEHINPMLKGMTEGQAKRAMIIAHGLSFVDLRFFEHLSMANPMKAGDFKASPYNALVSHLDYRKGWGGLRGGVDNTKDVPILYKMMYQRFVPYSLGKFGTHDWKPGAFYKDPEGYTLEEMRRHNDFFVDFVLNSYESDAIFNIDGLLTRIGWRFDLIEKEYVKPWIGDVGELYDSCKTEAAKNANQGVTDLKEQAAVLRRYVAMDVDDQTLCRYFEGVRKGMDKGSKEGWTPEHWRMYNQLYANQLGTISGWVTSSSRAGSEMDVLLKAGLGIDVVDNTRNGVLVEKEELEHLKKAYHVGVELNTRKMQHEKVIHLNYLGADGRFHSRADTYAVAERIKKTQHRAEYFEQTFARNPAALYMELGSVLPEMLDFSDVEKHDEWLWKAPVAKIHEYEVKAARHELTKDDEKKWELLKKAKEIRIRWGWDGGAQDHGAFDKLAILRDRLQMIVADDGPLAFVEGGRAKRLNYFFEEMGIATQRSGETERYVVGEKIVQSKDENGNVVEVKQNIFKDVKARRAAMRRDDIRKKIGKDRTKDGAETGDDYDLHEKLRIALFGAETGDGKLEGLVDVVRGFGERLRPNTDPFVLSNLEEQIENIDKMEREGVLPPAEVDRRNRLKADLKAKKKEELLKVASFAGTEGGLFFALAKRHELMHGEKLPYDDADLFKIMRPAGRTDETLFRRLISDAVGVEAQHVLGKMDDLAHDAFIKGDLKLLGESIHHIYKGRRGLSEEQAWESVKVFVNKMILFGAEPGIANRWWSSTEPLSSIVSAMHGYEGTLAKMAFQDKSTISLDSSDIAAVVDDWCELLGLPKGIREDIQIRYGAALERQYGSVVAPTVALFGFLLLIGLPALYAINKERNKKH